MTVGFSQTFPLDRDILSKALPGFFREPKMSKGSQMSTLGIGSRAVEGYTRWLSILGLRDSLRKQLTPLGELITLNDPTISQIGTKWVLHYQLSNKGDSQSAEAWYHFINHFLPRHDEFSRSDLKQFLEAESGIRTTNKKGPAADLGLVLNCYTHESALGELGIIKIIDRKNQIYRRGAPVHVTPLLIAYVLYDQKERLYPEASTVSIPEVMSAAGNIGKIFLTDKKQLEGTLALLQAEGYIRVLTFADMNHLEFFSRRASLDIINEFYKSLQR